MQILHLLEITEFLLEIVEFVVWRDLIFGETLLQILEGNKKPWFLCITNYFISILEEHMSFEIKQFVKQRKQWLLLLYTVLYSVYWTKLII